MKKLTLILAAMVLTASQAFGQCGKCGYEVKAENAYTNYNVRYASTPMMMKAHSQPMLRANKGIVAGAAKAPTDAPLLKMARNIHLLSRRLSM